MTGAPEHDDHPHAHAPQAERDLRRQDPSSPPLDRDDDPRAKAHPGREMSPGRDLPQPDPFLGNPYDDGRPQTGERGGDPAPLGGEPDVRPAAAPGGARLSDVDRGLADPRAGEGETPRSSGTMDSALNDEAKRQGHPTPHDPRTRGPAGGLWQHPDNAVAQDPALGDQVRAPQAPNRPASPEAARGTIHDPNSVTTGTDVEPTHDVFPARGER